MVLSNTLPTWCGNKKGAYFVHPSVTVFAQAPLKVYGYAISAVVARLKVAKCIHSSDFQEIHKKKRMVKIFAGEAAIS